MNEFVAIIFRLINFAITIGAAFYLFKRYGLSLILDKIKDRQKKIEALEIQLKKIEDDRILHEQLSERQKMNYEHLHKQLAVWNDQFNQELTAHEYEKKILKQKLEAKIATQNNFVQEQYVKEAIMPQALKQAREIIEKKATTEFGGLYLKNLLNHIKKSAQ